MSAHKAFIILPTQLYQNHDTPFKGIDIYVIEEPAYYFDKTYKPFKANRVKIAFLNASIRSYCKNKQFKLISWQTIQKNGYDFLQSYKEIVMYDPIDFEILEKYKNITNRSKAVLTILPSPDMLIDKETLSRKYYEKHGSKIKHATFYEFMKNELGVLKNIKNLDKENRSPPPKEAPHLYSFKPTRETLPIYEEAIHFANTYFPDHYGKTSNVKLYPITHKHAKKLFETFLLKRFSLFGQYEDAVMQEDPFMYHSIISPLLNIGLLTPKYILQRTLEFYNEHRHNIPLSSLEGFVRQVIGWRAFMQSLYIFKGKELVLSNLPNNQNTFRDISVWYNGTTGITPLDEEIKKAVSIGYSHHIVRLMMFMNFFILCELHPQEIYKWFMEVVSMDAYSWVMVSNIYAMGYFYPKILSKPYLSTSNYIVKMTNYKRNGEWDKTWDALYHDFVASKPSQYTFFYKRTLKKDMKIHDIAREFKSKYFTKLKSR